VSIALELPDDFVEAVAERAAEIVRADRRFLSKAALADRLGVSERCVKGWRAQGMPAYVGRPLMFDVREVEAWLAKRPV
jgi:phage terminase Nu1 subunit (DNA packaging protein)